MTPDRNDRDRRRPEILELAGAELIRGWRRRRRNQGIAAAVALLLTAGLAMRWALRDDGAGTARPIGTTLAGSPGAGGPPPSPAAPTAVGTIGEILDDDALARELERLDRPVGIAVVAGQVRLIRGDAEAFDAPLPRLH